MGFTVNGFLVNGEAVLLGQELIRVNGELLWKKFSPAFIRPGRVD